MQPKRTLFRFEPVTVRAAARVVSLGLRGELSPGEMAFYVAELARMEPGARPGSPRRLARLARRRAAFGRAGHVHRADTRRGVAARPPEEPAGVQPLRR